MQEDNKTNSLFSELRSVSKIVVQLANCTENKTVFFGGTEEAVEYDVIFLSKVSIAGLAFLLNLTSIWVFLHFKKRSIFISMLFYLSITEVVYNGATVVFECFYVLVVSNNHYWPIYGPQEFGVVLSYCVLYVVWVLYKSSLIVRNWTTVLIAWRRFRAISSPISTHSMLNIKSVRIHIAILSGISICITIPRAFEVGYLFCAESGQIVDILPAALTDVAVYQRFYPTLYFILTSPCPITFLVGCSILMVIKLRSRNEEIQKSNSRNSTVESCISQQPLNGQKKAKCQNKVTNRTVLILCIAFFFCELPMLIAGIIKDYDCNHICVLFLGIANMLTNLDSLINFIIYYFSIDIFKTQLLSCLPRFIMCKNNCGKNKQSTSTCISTEIRGNSLI